MGESQKRRRKRRRKRRKRKLTRVEENSIQSSYTSYGLYEIVAFCFFENIKISSKYFSISIIFRIFRLEKCD